MGALDPFNEPRDVRAGTALEVFAAMGVEVDEGRECAFEESGNGGRAPDFRLITLRRGEREFEASVAHNWLTAEQIWDACVRLRIEPFTFFSAYENLGVGGH